MPWNDQEIGVREGYDMIGLYRGHDRGSMSTTTTCSDWCFSIWIHYGELEHLELGFHSTGRNMSHSVIL
ncbi:hypothetical protein ES702_05937 [subsurface metagenome]